MGDRAGMAADLFETYAVTLIATMVLGGLMVAEAGPEWHSLPIAVGRSLHRRLNHRLLLCESLARHEKRDASLHSTKA